MWDVVTKFKKVDQFFQFYFYMFILVSFTLNIFFYCFYYFFFTFWTLNTWKENKSQEIISIAWFTKEYDEV